MTFCKTLLISSLCVAVQVLHSSERPNILWITLEDTSPHFIGCYGNKEAKTPHIDRLAARGVRFTSAFANGPVCSSARSTIITGIVNERLGTGNHRSSYPIPDTIKGFPSRLRANGYYTSNNSKTDYATSSAKRLIKESWNESSRKAGWEKRTEGQPFFSIFNIESCHQSRTMTWSYAWYRKNIFEKLQPENRIAETDLILPPFYPDSPEVRKHFARVYNSITKADEEVGQILARLEADKLTDDTIIFCYADHGEAMLRGKTSANGLGYRVPLIIAFPEKWQGLNPWGGPGTATRELVCFDDLAPTMQSLTGSKPDPKMTGRAFLGSHRTPPRPYVFLSRNRIDESAGCSRSITDGRYLYTRHFLPGAEQKLLKYADVSDISGLLRTAHKDGKLTDLQASMFSQQPHEVLHDLQSDPWELTNLAANPEQSERLSTLRTALFNQVVTNRDVMMLPEYELASISKESTPYDHGNDMAPQDFQQLLHAADLASRPETHPEILQLARSDSPALTYWAAVALRTQSKYRRDDFTLADFSYPPAKIEFAAARTRFDQDAEARQVLATFALSDDPQLSLHALQRIQDLGEEASHFAETLQKATMRGSYHTKSSAEVTLHLLEGRPITYPDPK